MNILIIGGTAGIPTSSDREYYQKYIDFFVKSAEVIEEDVSISAAMIDDLLVQVGDGALDIYDTHNKREVSEYDALFFRGSKFRTHIDVIATVTEYARRHSIKTVNDYSNVRDTSKLFQATQFEVIGAPVAKTLYVNTALLNNFDRVSNWKFPCIMKAKHGSHGNDNYLVKSLQEVKEILAQDIQKHFVLQRFIPNEGDFRILIIGDETKIIGRSSQGASHLNNTSQGGIATDVAVGSLPSEVLQQARSIADHFSMTIAGVDVLQDTETGQFFFLEVNSQPQLMTGAFTDEKSQLLGKLLQKIGSEK